MAKRRVQTGMGDAIAQSGIVSNNQENPEEGLNLLDLAGKGISSDSASGISQETANHYFDIGKLAFSGGNTQDMPRGALDDNISDAVRSGELDNQRESLAGIANLVVNGEGYQDDAGEVGLSDITSDAPQGTAGIDYFTGDEETPYDQELPLTGDDMEGIGGLGSTEESYLPQNDMREVGDTVEPESDLSIMGGIRKKGPGFFGELERPDGDFSTELSVEYDIDGRTIEMPSLVPTLSDQEVKHLLADGEPTPEMTEKIISHALQREEEGKSPFAEIGEQTKRAVLQSNDIDEALQNPDIRNFIQTESGMILDGLEEQKVKDYNSLINGLEAEDANEAQRINDLRMKIETKDLTKTDIALLGAALLLPTLFAYKEGGSEGMMEAISGGLKGGVDAYKLGLEQRQNYGKELTEAQKQHIESQAKRSEMSEEWLNNNVSDYGVKKELQGIGTYTDSNGNKAVNIGGSPNIFFNMNSITSEKDIEAMRKALPEIRTEVAKNYDMINSLEDISATLRQVEMSNEGEPGYIKKLFTKKAAGVAGPKAMKDGKEISLATQLRSELENFKMISVKDASGHTKQLIDVITGMIEDPTKSILGTTISNAIEQTRALEESTINVFSNYLYGHGVNLEPIAKGAERTISRREYDLTDEQAESKFRNLSKEKKKALLGAV